MAVRYSAESQAHSAASGIPAGDVFTITCWIYISTDRNTYSGPWAVHGVDGTDRTQLSTDLDGTTLRLFDNNLYGSGLGGFALSTGTWYRVGVSMNGSDVSFTAAAATAALSTTTASDFTPQASPTGLFVGRIQNTNAFFNGRIANFKLWQSALTVPAMENELWQYLPLRTTNLLRWHPFLATETVERSGASGALSGGTSSTTEAGPPIPWGSRKGRLHVPAAAGTASPTAQTASFAFEALDAAAPVLANAEAALLAWAAQDAAFSSSSAPTIGDAGIGLSAPTAMASVGAAAEVASFGLTALAPDFAGDLLGEGFVCQDFTSEVTQAAYAGVGAPVVVGGQVYPRGYDGDVTAINYSGDAANCGR